MKKKIDVGDTFYYRYLKADQGILPPFVAGVDKDRNDVENISKCSWWKQQVLYKASTGLNGRNICFGGLYFGYHGSDDIIKWRERSISVK